MASDRLVLDASYALEALLPTTEESRAEAAHLLRLISAGDIEGRVPWLFFAEVAAVVTRYVRGNRGRKIEAEDAQEFLSQIDGLGLQVDLSLEGCGALYSQAQRWNVGAYDGTYLDLAMQMHIPIATRDKGLITAARLAKVPIYTATS